MAFSIAQRVKINVWVFISGHIMILNGCIFPMYSRDYSKQPSGPVLIIAAMLNTSKSFVPVII